MKAALQASRTCQGRVGVVPEAGWLAKQLPSAPEVAHHGAEVHACLLIPGDSQSHDREIQQQKRCDQLDFIFHQFTMIGHSTDCERGVQPVTVCQNNMNALGGCSR